MLPPEPPSTRALDDLRQLGMLALLDVLSGRPGERPEDVLLDLKLVDDHALALALAHPERTQLHRPASA